ncbi:MAG: LLM class flavin-dependent oxidoreductase, partial [Ilumatobacteraceae bacterium]
AVRHLELHRGHLTELNRHDEKVMTGPIAVTLSRSGSAAHWRDRLAAAAAAGATEVAFQPAGDDLHRELAMFIDAANG